MVIKPQIIIGASVVVFLILLVSLAQEMNRRLQVQREVQRLQAEVQVMERNIIELENLNQYFRTDAYQERLAREKLNYQAPGEKVVLIPEEQQSQSVEGSPTEEPTTPIPYPERWWRAFFVPPSSSAPIE